MLVRKMHVEVRGAAVHCPVMTLVDRRSSRPRSKEWVFSTSIERILFGPNEVAPPSTPPTPPCFVLLVELWLPSLQRTTGAFHVLLQKHSFDDAVLCCQRSAVAAGTITDEEFDQIKNQYKPLVADVEARNRVVRLHTHTRTRHHPTPTLSLFPAETLLDRPCICGRRRMRRLRPL
jgi:hypothetical protein